MTAAGTAESRGTRTERPSRETTTSRCTAPPGETCFGECAYWEADTALTGLALLTYLGAGYTHTDGRYSEVVGKGLDFLLAQQKPDGDLRGRQPGRRHVLPRDGDAGVVRGLRPDRR